MKGRALTIGEKRALLDRLLQAWLCSPHERLGQLLVNSLPTAAGNDAYYIEDYELIQAAEKRTQGNL